MTSPSGQVNPLCHVDNTKRFPLLHEETIPPYRVPSLHWLNRVPVVRWVIDLIAGNAIRPCLPAGRFRWRPQTLISMLRDIPPDRSPTECDAQPGPIGLSTQLCSVPTHYAPSPTMSRHDQRLRRGLIDASAQPGDLAIGALERSFARFGERLVAQRLGRLFDRFVTQMHFVRRQPQVV